MNKTAIKNFAIWARNKLIADVRYRAGLVGITEQGIQTALPQSDATTEFYDIGTATPYAISGQTVVRQRRNLAEAIRRRAEDADYSSAYRYIMEEVAYTWFNRLIAVRFMEVNDYLPGRVRALSSESGKIEPDLVTTPFDAELNFTAEEERTVLQLKQDNKLDELFRLLFIKQCNALHDILPALFERRSDYTELLLNLSVVDQDGVVWRLTHDIPEEDFNVEQGGQVEIIGWLYQYYNTEPKAQVFARPSGQKIRKEDIPAATQLFTPDWIVRYMVENSLGRLWLEGHPGEGLRANWKYYLDEAEQEPEVQAHLEEIRAERRTLNPEDIKVIDPCMGSGHILVYAFDVLMQIYESQGYSPRDAAQSIVRCNLYGLDIDKRAAQLAYFAVMMKARQYDRRFLTRNLQPMVYSTTGDEDGENFGSLLMVDEPGEMPEEPQSVYDLPDYERRLNVWNYRYLLAQRYHVVCTNPPYMAVSNASGKVQEYVKKNFPDSKADLFAVFIERCGQMATEYQAMITQQSWMFLSSFEKLRAKLQAVDTVNMAHLGARAFEEIGGEVVQTTSFVMRKSRVVGFKGTYCRLIEPNTQQGKEEMFLAGENRYAAQQDNFSKIPGAPVAYWASLCELNIFGSYPRLINVFETRNGMSTTNNDLFLKLWFEVIFNKIGISDYDAKSAAKSGKKWFPYNKGGEFRRWYGNRFYVVNWENDGQELKRYVSVRYGSYSKEIRSENRYFFESVTWSGVGANKSGFRYSPKGVIFDSGANGLFTLSKEELYYILGLLNTKLVDNLLQLINPTINTGSGTIGNFPVAFDRIFLDCVVKKVVECIELSKTDWDSFETSWDFKRHPLV